MDLFIYTIECIVPKIVTNGSVRLMVSVEIF